MAGIDDILAETARRAAEVNALQGRIGPALDDFVARASHEQATLFAAACVERAAGILFWKASAEGRQDEVEAYSRALEQIWGNPIEGDPITSDAVEGMHEIARYDEPINREPLYKAAGFAQSAAFAVRSALILAESGDTSIVRGVSSTLWKDASLIARRTETPHLTAEEIGQQIADMTKLLDDGATEETSAALREESRRIGRQWLELVAAYAES